MNVLAINGKTQPAETAATGSMRGGFTLLELLLAISLLAIVAFKAYNTMDTLSETVAVEDVEAQMEDQARRVLRQIAYEVMGSSRETLKPDAPAPGGTASLRYQVNLGVQDGKVVWGDPEKLALEDEMGQVVWSDNPDTEAERRVVWSNLVAPYLEGEIPDGMDNNGNGLIDEKGLSFVMDGNSVTVRMTLERFDNNGVATTKTVQTTVTCRNWVSEE